jgi:hypothetical protein
MSMEHNKNVSIHMRLQLIVGLPVRQLCFCTKAAVPLKQKTLAKLKHCAENHWNVAEIAIYVNDGLCVATDYWLAQSFVELTLLGLYLHTSPPATARDVPIYTANGPARLITTKLDDGVELCMIAGKSPSTQQVIQTVSVFHCTGPLTYK